MPRDTKDTVVLEKRIAKITEAILGCEMTPMQEVVLVLSATYTSEGVATWLAGRNKKLEDERPIELLAAGDSTRVLEAAYVLLGMVAS